MNATHAKKQSNLSTFEALKGSFGYRNVMQTPKIIKVVVSSGVGSVKDKKKLEVVADRLTKITGQKPAPRQAKKSIASFKLREGEVIGYQVTMRGPRMQAFVERLVHIALPRTRDFRGLSSKAIDEMGNLTIGVKEHTIFPETADEDLKDVFGMSITIVTTSRNKTETLAFLKHLGFPFKAN
jgi:large subunit ribosomal protein L5